MKRKNKNKLVNWILFGCSVATIGCFVYLPTAITGCCAGVCTGMFVAHALNI